MSGRRKPIRHGTGGGYRAHYRHGVPMCEECRAVERTRRGWKAPQRVAPCGSDGGYAKHRRNGEEACGPCRAAHAERTRPYRLAYQRRQAEARRQERAA